jgi:hypothetical protein
MQSRYQEVVILIGGDVEGGSFSAVAWSCSFFVVEGNRAVGLGGGSGGGLSTALS